MEELIRAIKEDDVQQVRKLLASDPSLIRTPVNEGSLLLMAVYKGASKVAQLLASKSPPPDIFEASAIGDARRVGEIVKVDRGKVDSVNKEGFTPLGLAAFLGHLKVASVLLEGGADLERVMPSVNRNTALDAAVASQQVDVVELLLSKGAKVDVKAARGYTPLHKSAFGGHLELTKILLDHGADPGAETDEGRTPLDIAIERGHDAVAKLLGEGA